MRPSHDHPPEPSSKPEVPKVEPGQGQVGLAFELAPPVGAQVDPNLDLSVFAEVEEPGMSRTRISFTPEELAEAKADLAGTTAVFHRHQVLRDAGFIPADARVGTFRTIDLPDEEIIAHHRMMKPLWESGRIRKPSTDPIP